jgi:folate-binding protein YgfZ
MMATLAEQAAALDKSAGVRVRDDLVLARVTGDDRRSWLNGQITNDVRELKPGDAVYALAVNVRGKVLADLWVVDRGEHLALLLPGSAVAAVQESFEQQIIMEDVEVATDPSSRIVSVQGARAEEAIEAAGGSFEAYRADEIGHGGRLIVISEGELEQALGRLLAGAERVGGGGVGDEAFELARVRAGRPRFGRDFWDQHYPQEAGLKELAVSFNKGCYLGQEVVCTLENRGRLTRQLVRLRSIDGGAPAPGSELRDGEGGNPGVLTSVVTDPDLGRWLALGYAKRSQTAVGTQLHAGAARFEVLGLAGGGTAPALGGGASAD